jgi:TonB family protein
MLKQTSRREADTAGVGAAYETDRSRLSFALILLLVALAVVVVKDREFWFGDAETPVADETSPEWVPSSVVKPPVTPVAPAVQAKKQVAAAKSSAEPPVAGRAAVATSRAVIPPLEIEVIAGDPRDTVHLGSNPVKVEIPRDSKSGATGSMAAERAPATIAAERVPMSLDGNLDKTRDKAQARPQPVEASYPLLGRQMKVQGSVLLQALIGADGVIRDLRVLSGPAILASAAREAARRWQFKPYLQNGQAVETQANIMVNFTIKVLDNATRDQMDSVVAQSRGGE